jgi:hypothetical protein
VALPTHASIAASAVFAIGALVATGATAVPPTPEELATICGQAEGPAHCGRLIEAMQLKRLPNLATRDGITLKVSLFPSGSMSFTDTEALNGGRAYSLWDYMSEINTAVIYAVDGDDMTFTLLQRASGHKTELPSDPKLSPDRARIATADFCDHCTNEIAIWRVSRDGIRKESTWKPKDRWSDVVANWKDAQTLAIEYMTPGSTSHSRLDRMLDDPSWSRSTSP